MIPEQITRDHVLAALAEISASSIPASRQSVDYDVVHDGNAFPPKYVITKAVRHLMGQELAPEEFNSLGAKACLEKLGFEVVRRKKPPEVGKDSGVEVVAFVFERLVPDAALRKLVLEAFADSIEAAHEVGESRWEITLQTDAVRLNAGTVIAFDVRPEDVLLGLAPEKLDPATKAQLEATGKLRGGWAALPGVLKYRCPHEELPSLWPTVREAVRAYVASCADTTKQCVWARFHAAAVVEYISASVGRALPKPVYSAKSQTNEAPEARRVFWVNQGKELDGTGSDAFVFATEKSSDGAVPGHWARVRELRVGDVLVHYAGKAVRGVSRVRAAAKRWTREATGHEGFRADVDFWPLSEPISVPAIFADEAARVAAEVDQGHGPFDKNGDVKQGYLWAFSEAGLLAVRAAASASTTWPEWASTSTRQAWMFHANPEFFDVRGATRALPEVSWAVRQHKNQMRVGDTVFLWETGSEGGVVAMARILSEPTPAVDDPAEAPFRKPGHEFEAGGLDVRLAIERVIDPVLPVDEMRADQTLRFLPAIAAPQGRTNSVVLPAQADILLRWAETGERPPRILKVAPGRKAEHWEECRANNYVCVGWDDIGDLSKFASWSAFRKAFAETCEVGKPQGHVTVKAHELWALTRLRPGDKVVANRGTSRVLAVGTVREPGYVWDDTRSTSKHTVAVDWDTSVATDIPPYDHWGVTTIDKVPPNVIAMVAPEMLPADVSPAAAKATAATPSVPPKAAGPFASLVRALQSKEARLWFSDEVIAHYLLALQAKRLVILTGVSGTGKTQLALAVARHFQPQIRRRKVSPPPAGAVVKRVNPTIHKSRSTVIPAALAVDLKLGGLVGTGTATVDLLYPGGKAELSCWRDVRSAGSSVHHLSLKGHVAEWLRSLPLGTELLFELLEPEPNGRDRLRISVPKEEQETTVLRNYEVVAVRPDWTDGRGLLGFYNPLTRRYATTPFLRLLLEARAEVERAAAEQRTPAPFFAILDEMNLARVEQYFADFLSSLESEEPLVLHDDALLEEGEIEDDEEDADLEPVPRRLVIPPNVFFTGTVNVDETTYMFSPKVLDRAFVIEFNEVDLAGYGLRDEETVEPCALALEGWDGFGEYRRVTAADWDALADLEGGDVRALLTEIHAILAQENRHFGYRVANEIGRFIQLSATQGANPKQGVLDALDLCVLSKILPKLHGTQQELEDVLCALFAFAVGKDRPTPAEKWSPQDGELTCTAEGQANVVPRLPRSSLKLWRMLRRLRAQGFTAFIE